MSNDQDEILFYEDMMDEDGYALVGFRLLSFIDPKGKVHYRMAQYGDGPASHLIGLMEMAKIEIFTASKMAANGDDESS